MNGNAQQGSQPPAGSVPQAVNVIALVVQSLAVTVEVFIRRRMGSRYLDRQAAVALLLIPGFGLLWPEHDLEPLMWFLAAFLVATTLVRIRSLRRRFRGEEEHSRYNGWPVILSWPVFRRLSEAKAKALAEPFLAFGVGGVTTNVSVPLGAYLMAAAFGLMFSDGMLRAFEQQRLLDLKDQLADQRRIAERFRDVRR